MPRDLGEVINKMLEHIPASEEDFRSELESCLESFKWTSPETVPLRWKSTAEALEDNMPEQGNFNEWQQKIYNVWMDME